MNPAILGNCLWKDRDGEIQLTNWALSIWELAHYYYFLHKFHHITAIIASKTNLEHGETTSELSRDWSPAEIRIIVVLNSPILSRQRAFGPCSQVEIFFFNTASFVIKGILDTNQGSMQPPKSFWPMQPCLHSIFFITFSTNFFI